MRAPTLLRVLGAAILAVALPGPGTGPVEAQEAGGELVRKLQEAPDGQVRLRFETDEGVVVCDDGSVSTGGQGFYWGRGGEDRRCQELEAQIRFSVQGGRVVEISRPEPSREVPDGTDLGVVAGPVAGDLFMRLAREAPDRVAEDAIFPAVVARNATVWPGLLELARDRSRSSALRKKTVFWLGQEAAATVNDDLAMLAEDDSEAAEIRDAAVFALSQRPDDEGVPALMELVRTSGDPRVRKKAIFWLAQSRDPRVVPFFEEILLERGGA